MLFKFPNPFALFRSHPQHPVLRDRIKADAVNYYHRGDVILPGLGVLVHESIFENTAPRPVSYGWNNPNAPDPFSGATFAPAGIGANPVGAVIAGLPGIAVDGIVIDGAYALPDAAPLPW